MIKARRLLLAVIMVLAAACVAVVVVLWFQSWNDESLREVTFSLPLPLPSNMDVSDVQDETAPDNGMTIADCFDAAAAQVSMSREVRGRILLLYYELCDAAGIPPDVKISSLTLASMAPLLGSHLPPIQANESGVDAFVAYCMAMLARRQAGRRPDIGDIMAKTKICITDMVCEELNSRLGDSIQTNDEWCQGMAAFRRVFQVWLDALISDPWFPGMKVPWTVEQKDALRKDLATLIPPGGTVSSEPGAMQDLLAEYLNRSLFFVSVNAIRPGMEAFPHPREVLSSGFSNGLHLWPIVGNITYVKDGECHDKR